MCFHQRAAYMARTTSGGPYRQNLHVGLKVGRGAKYRGRRHSHLSFGLSIGCPNKGIECELALSWLSETLMGDDLSELAISVRYSSARGCPCHIRKLELQSLQ